jgi:microcompartment protein CcmL/EutN
VTAAVRDDAIGLMEVGGFAASLAALDAAIKAAPVDVMQLELNDLYGVSIRLRGMPADLSAALGAGRKAAEGLSGDVVTRQINAPHAGSRAAYVAAAEYSPLIEQAVVAFPRELTVSEQAPFAIGMIETQGLTAVIEAIDTACKAGNVEVLGREKLGGGYVTVILKGDVAAVQAAVEAGKARLNDLGLGKLIAAHVIARPTRAVLSLIPPLVAPAR